ncbi:MAG: hypothetical protein KZQ83_14925 [gamma proteobacterium symbiont of Taylorina sp.]|nr:hypothetical protein [gamma proteobacterium symbiont of Taylorina sp.]
MTPGELLSSLSDVSNTTPAIHLQNITSGGDIFVGPSLKASIDGSSLSANINSSMTAKIASTKLAAKIGSGLSATISDKKLKATICQ